jgi:hypothetical protein
MNIRFSCMAATAGAMRSYAGGYISCMTDEDSRREGWYNSDDMKGAGYWWRTQRGFMGL